MIDLEEHSTKRVLQITAQEDDSDFNRKENNSNHLKTKDNLKKMSHDTKSASDAKWANSIQKILHKKRPKGKKTVVLAKAKKLDIVEVKPKEVISFEIDGVKEEIKTEETSEETKELAVQIKSRKRESLGIRVKPSFTDRERERILQKIATKGVVQLFNAVKQQQTEINTKLSQAGPLERKREQVLKSIDKNSFLDILMGGSKSIPVDNPVKPEAVVVQTENKDKDNKTWSVLRDDFVMGAKLKDWDKEDEEEEEEAENDSSASEDMDSGD